MKKNSPLLVPRSRNCGVIDFCQLTRPLAQHPLADIVLELADRDEAVIGEVVAGVRSTAQPVEHSRGEDAAAEAVEGDGLLALGAGGQQTAAGARELLDPQALVVGHDARGAAGEPAEAGIQQIEHLLRPEVAVPAADIVHADHAGELAGAARPSGR
ncbi:MAG: hypothetical protein R3C69_02575 [Geminicoccaceae bacterium]